MTAGPAGRPAFLQPRFSDLFCSLLSPLSTLRSSLIIILFPSTPCAPTTPCASVYSLRAASSLRSWFYSKTSATLSKASSVPSPTLEVKAKTPWEVS